MVSIIVSRTLFTERRNEAIQVSCVDGYENKKMFFVTSLLCDTEAKTSAVWSLISEKSISVIVLSDFNQGSIFEATNIKFRVLKFYPVGWVGRGGGVKL